MNDNKINFRTPRTIAGTVMEGVVGVLVLILWVLIICLSRTATHDATQTLVVIGIQSTILAPLMMVLCYFPKTFNIPKRNPRAEHYLLSIQLVRIVCIFVMLIMIALAWMTGRPDDAKTVEGLQAVLVCGLLLTVGYYMFKILRIN